MTEKTIPRREDIQDGHKWDLSPLFSSDTQWNAVYQEIEKKMASYATYKGRMAQSLSVFKNAIEFHLWMQRKIETLHTYAHLKSDEDRSNQLYLGLFQRAVSLLTRVAESSSFLVPEIQSIPEDIIKSYLQDESLSRYRFYIQKILRHKPHTHDEKIEQILALSQDVTQAPSQVFGQLDNVDLKFGTLKDESGREVELSHGNFLTFLMNPDRDIRKKAFYQYYRAYDDHKNTIATTHFYSIKKDHFYARVRNFENCRAAALFGDDVSEKVYDNLIETVKENLEPLFEYLRFRKQALGLRALHPYDIYVPIVGDIEFNMSYEEAVNVIEAAMSPLGESYTRVLKEGLLGGWVDRYESRGKRSGAYSSGCYDSPPYILLNYDDRNINSLYTLAHEAGHSMHSYYSKQHQPYVDYEYTIFVAEVTSTFNENLLTRYLLTLHEDNPRMKAFILNREIDNIRATLIRQSMFAEFENITHHMVEENQPLTLEVIRDQYRGLLELYFGDIMIIDAELELECLRIPHFYSAFYVYKYATGVSAAIALADKVIREGEEARNAYLDFLKLGGSKFPLDELMTAGVDMRTPEPVQRALDHFKNLVDQFIQVYKSLK
ncbi:MAG: oligoendopeptidase F [Deltaproteobacteria bacterium]|nr:oligoendopeptidase F [Deltaproteobacteria bacterium]